MPPIGLEPIWACARQILSLLCLPVPPQRQNQFIVSYTRNHFNTRQFLFWLSPIFLTSFLRLIAFSQISVKIPIFGRWFIHCSDCEVILLYQKIAPRRLLKLTSHFCWGYGDNLLLGIDVTTNNNVREHLYIKNVKYLYIMRMYVREISDIKYPKIRFLKIKNKIFLSTKHMFALTVFAYNSRFSCFYFCIDDSY